MATTVLHKSCKAEDVVHRLGQVMHAAFLHAGFVPYGPNPPSGHLFKQSCGASGTSICLSRLYTAPQLAHRKDAEAAVLMLCTAQGSGDNDDDIALVIFLTADHDPRSSYREILDAATLEPLISLTEAERSRIRASLGNVLCWGFLHELCRRNGLPLSGFASLPDFAKVEILKRLRSGEDLASVECTCRDLRRVVAARDGELWRHMASHEAPANTVPMDYEHIVRYVDWKAMYDDLLGRWIDHDEYEALRRCASRCEWRPFVPVDVKSFEGLVRWKEEYLRARNRLWAGSRVPFRWTTLLSAPKVSWRLRDLHHPQRLEPQDDDETRRSTSHRRNIQNVPRKDYSNKRDHNPSGAIHSPSSRNRWKHR
ncbi:unnamed protein product [Urochloa decumbens]|uniref:F-box domain-containing protein n=1 Tax=Urochloa decumbens TaxID=240449 RepID=A0ABC8XWZ6_9POAL